MHPFMAIWIWSMTMMRVAASGFGDMATATAGHQEQSPQPAIGRAVIAFHPIIAATGPYWVSSVLEERLPDRILDELSSIYWHEAAPEIAA